MARHRSCVFIIPLVVSLLLCTLIVPAGRGNAEPRERFIGVLGNSITVDADGSGDYRTVQEGIDAAENGDVVFVREGSYRENVTISGKSITLIGEGNDRTVLDSPPWNGTPSWWDDNWSTGPPCITIRSGNNRISGLRFQRGTWGVVIESGKNNVVDNCTFYWLGHGLFIRNSDGNRIENTTVFDSLCGIRMENSDENTVLENHFLRNGYDWFVHGSGDKDRNGVPDDQEPGNPNADSDSDGLCNGFEREELGTDPLEPDTDGDGLWDHLEIRLRLNPLLASSDRNGTQDRNIPCDYAGIYLEGSNDVRMSNNLHEDHQGIMMESSSYNEVSKSNIALFDHHWGRSCDNSRFKKSSLLRCRTANGENQRDTVSSLHYSEWPPDYRTENFGISLGSGSNHNEINDNDLSSFEMGITILDGRGNLVVNNTCYSHTLACIRIENSDGSTISANDCSTFNVPYWSYGIFISRSKDCIIERNHCFHSHVGIYQEESSNCILGNNCSDNCYGFFISGCDKTRIENNSINSNDEYGTFLRSSVEIKLTTNEFSSNRIGIKCYRGDVLEINSNCLNEDLCGILLEMVNNSICKGNEIENNENHSLLLWGSSHNEIENNTFGTCNGTSIALSNQWSGPGSNGNVIHNNTLKHGLTIAGSGNNYIFFNDLLERSRYETEDNGYENRWNNSFGGNYWRSNHGGGECWHHHNWDCDGISKYPHQISGSANSRDHLPLKAQLRYLIPMANAGNDRTIGQFETVVLNASLCNGIKSTLNYTWSLIYNGTPQTLYGCTSMFRFDHMGEYTVTLEIRDFLGRNDTDTMTVTVLDSVNPFADAGVDITIEQHQNVMFDGSGSFDNGELINFTWTFVYNGMNVSLNGVFADFTFHDVGIYHIDLKVTDSEGNWDTDDMTVLVLDITPPLADAGPDQSIEMGDTVNFDGSGSRDNVGIVNHIWFIFYNDTEINLFGKRPTLRFDLAGTYNVTLKVWDERGYNDEDNVTIIVLDSEDPLADAGEDITAAVDTEVILNGNGSVDNIGITNFTWVWIKDGNLVTLYGISPAHTFTSSGDYWIKLEVRDRAGNHDMDFVLVLITGENGSNWENEVGRGDGENDGEGEDGSDDEGMGVMAMMTIGIISIAILGMIVGLSIYLWPLKDEMGPESEEEEEDLSEDEMGRVNVDIRKGDKI